MRNVSVFVQQYFRLSDDIVTFGGKEGEHTVSVRLTHFHINFLNHFFLHFIAWETEARPRQEIAGGRVIGPFSLGAIDMLIR